ncbi:MAG: hypothetical protein HS104_02815 [Polyangiaceae bacterium]|nr:hypothetical protein [Polyangiaceae bacterium]MCL4751218.1 hypothetical protein [Myxococcales bacterium]
MSLALGREPSMDGVAMEPGLVTLAKIVGLLGVAISLIPLVFIFSPGSREEPKDHLAGLE